MPEQSLSSSISTPMVERPRYLLPVIVFAQFAGTSLWFAGNVIMKDLQTVYGISADALGDLTAIVQLGFIVGTLTFAVLTIADRFSPSKVFFTCALLAACCNLGVYILADDYASVLALRFGVGFFLSGIYPVGMKISADWYAKGLGKALGYLVGALVLGTAFPHLLREMGGTLDWRLILMTTSGVATLGGIMIVWLVPDGPFRQRGSQFNPAAIAQIFRYPTFRAAAFGYFGHMWELYAFWAFVPVLLAYYQGIHDIAFSVSLWCFVIIAIGSLGCILGGYVSLRTGSSKVAFAMLLASCICCLLSPLALQWAWPAFAWLLLLWGFAVVGDSPQFSTLVARTAPKEYVGSALTIVNSLGFAITIGSIQLLNRLYSSGHIEWMFLLLVPGPIFGLISLWMQRKELQAAR